jgi:hypothetical protein
MSEDKPMGANNQPPEYEHLDPYTYARHHASGPGAWCVIGPDDFEMVVPKLDKNVAYAIGKLLSGRVEDAKRMIDPLARVCWATIADTALPLDGDLEARLFLSEIVGGTPEFDSQNWYLNVTPAMREAWFIKRERIARLLHDARESVNSALTEANQTVTETCLSDPDSRSSGYAEGYRDGLRLALGFMEQDNGGSDHQQS